jgi:hypothetical protein
MRVSVTATPQGLAEWKEIVMLVHSYILHVLCGGCHPGFDSADIDDVCEAAHVSLALPSASPSSDTASSKLKKNHPSNSHGTSRSHPPSKSTLTGDCFGIYTLCGTVSSIVSWCPPSFGPVASLAVTPSQMQRMTASVAALAPWHAESAAIEAAEYDFSEDPDDPMESVTRLSVAMMLGATEADILPAWRRLNPLYCAPATAILLSHLHVGNLRIDISSPMSSGILALASSVGTPAKGNSSSHPAVSAFPVDSELLLHFSAVERANLQYRHEPHTGVLYSLSPIDSATLHSWRNPVPSPLVFHLPSRNPFVPTTLRGLCDSSMEGGVGIQSTLVEQNAAQIKCGWVECSGTSESALSTNSAVLSRLWHKIDSNFHVPRTVVDIFIHLPALSNVDTFDSLLMSDPPIIGIGCRELPNLTCSVGGSPVDASTLYRAQTMAFSAGIPGLSHDNAEILPPRQSLANATVLARLYVACVLDSLSETSYFAGWCPCMKFMCLLLPVAISAPPCVEQGLLGYTLR